MALAAGCRAQTAPIDAQLSRRIEILVRSQFPVPPGYVIQIGARGKSEISGYDALPITFARGEKSTTVNFLLSQDGKTLARLEKFDLSKDPATIISTANRPVRGNPEAKVVLVNFDDLECPYCAQMHQTLFPGTLDRYRGLVRVVYKDLPLVEIHPWAMHAAIDANCLAEQNGAAYWSYVDYLHAHSDEVTGPDRNLAAAGANLDRFARAEGGRAKLNPATLDACLARQDEAPVRASMKEGEGLGVDGTPTLFVNGERISGVVPAAQVWAAIDRALKSEGIQPPAAPGASQTAPAASGGQQPPPQGQQK